MTAMHSHVTALIALADQINGHDRPTQELDATLELLLSLVKSLDPSEVSVVLDKVVTRYRSRAFS